MSQRKARCYCSLFCGRGHPASFHDSAFAKIVTRFGDGATAFDGKKLMEAFGWDQTKAYNAIKKCRKPDRLPYFVTVGKGSLRFNTAAALPSAERAA